MRPLLRLALLATVAATTCLASGRAWAQFTDGGTTTSAGFVADDFFVRAQDIQGHTLSDFEVARYFNKARCDCSQNVYVYVALSQQGLAKQATVTEGNIEVWLGTTCNDINLRGARCIPLAKTSVSAFLHDLAGRLYVPTDARNMASQPNLGTGIDGSAGGGFPNPDCTMTGEQASQTIWVLWDKEGDGAPESAATQSVDFDVRPPPPPTINSVEGGNQALVVHWTGINAASYPDLIGYQVLCNRAGDLQVFANSTFDPGFQTCTSPTPKPIPDAGPISIDPNFDGGVETLNPLFACSPLLSPTTSSYRVKILQNAITYGVAVVAIDRSGNASVPDVFYGAPIKTKSFYDVYRNDDDQHPGSASGGLCTLGAGPVSGTIGGTCAALGLAAIVLARRSRRGRRR